MENIFWWQNCFDVKVGQYGYFGNSHEEIIDKIDKGVRPSACVYIKQQVFPFSNDGQTFFQYFSPVYYYINGVKYSPYSILDKENLRGRWFRVNSSNIEKMITSFNMANFKINDEYFPDDFLLNCSWLDGSVCGKFDF